MMRCLLQPQWRYLGRNVSAGSGTINYEMAPVCKCHHRAWTPLALLPPSLHGNGIDHFAVKLSVKFVYRAEKKNSKHIA